MGWKIFTLFPVFDLSLCYPISLKFINPVLANRLKEFLDSHDMLIPEKFGFRARYSKQHQLWRVSELIHEGLRSGVWRGQFFLTLKKAFYKVWQVALLFKLFALAYPVN